MTDQIERPPVTKILSLDEARAALGRKDPAEFGVAGMKAMANKEFVLTTSLTVATGVAERVYNLMSEQQAEGLSKVEFMCMQHVEQLRQEIEGRTLRGRFRRFIAWLTTPMVRLTREDQVAIADALTPTGMDSVPAPEPRSPEVTTCECHGATVCPAAHPPAEVPRG